MFRIRFPEYWVGRGHYRVVEMAVVGEPERESIHLLPEEVPGSLEFNTVGSAGNQGAGWECKGVLPENWEWGCC